MSNILLINQYASTPTTGAVGWRHHYFARELAKLGHNVTLVGARQHHLLREDIDTDRLPADELIDGYRFVRLDVPQYSHAHDKRRILAWLVFTTKLLSLRRRLAGVPDVVLYSSPQLPGFLAAERLARAYGARLILEVRDIWPLTLVEIGGYDPMSPSIRFLQWIEDRAYARADSVVSNLEGAVEHMAARGMDRDRFTWVSNGIAIGEVEQNEPLPPELYEQIPKNGLRVVYSGTLGMANALDTLIDAAAMLNDLPDVTILLVGQGRARFELEARSNSMQLGNVRFLGPVPKAQVQSVLAVCDACYIGWLASPLYRWGIAPNKVPEYFFSGKPIIHGFSGEKDPVAKFNAGITVPAEDPQALANAIRRLHAMPEAERRILGSNGRQAALEHYDYAKLARTLEQVLIGPKGKLS